MDSVQPLVDLARATTLRRAQAGLSELRNPEAVSVGGEILKAGLD
jgi:hypothetical protein